MSEFDGFLEQNAARLIAFRRDLHAHPELSGQEFRTTARVADALVDAGLSPRALPGGTGLVCDVGDGPATVGLRGDLDALPITDGKAADYRSSVAGVCHACGHDVHTTVLLGAGLLLARLAATGRLRRGVRLLFQPAEEVMPGGALDVIAAGGLDGLERVYALHCDPSLAVGRVGLRVGAVSSAADRVEVRISGPGGHTARPHLTVDLVAALSDVLARVPGLVVRRVDPRAGVNLVWGEVHAGSAANVVPRSGIAVGTLRVLDRDAWQTVPSLVADTVREVVASYGAHVEVLHTRGVPPVVNDAACVSALATAAARHVGGDAVCDVEQSLGGEDFGWFLEKVPGALARLGVRSPNGAGIVDLHQPTFDVDEACIAVGVRLLAGVASLG